MLKAVNVLNFKSMGESVVIYTSCGRNTFCLALMCPFAVLTECKTSSIVTYATKGQ